MMNRDILSTQIHMCRCSKVGYKNIHVIINASEVSRKKLKLNYGEQVVII